VGVDGRPHAVPIVHAIVGDLIVFAVDNKPKSGRPLRRVDNITANPRVAVLFDHRSEDWEELWWVRADGVASIHDVPPAAARRLHERYPEYERRTPDGPWVQIAVDRWTGWQA